MKKCFSKQTQCTTLYQSHFKQLIWPSFDIHFIWFNFVIFPVSCHLGLKGPNGKIVLIRFEHVHKKYKTRVGDRQRKSGICGILAQKVSVHPFVRPSVCPSVRINYAPLSNLTMYKTGS